MKVTPTLKAVMEGHFAGDIHVCNPILDVVALLGDVVVRGTGSGAQAPTPAPGV